MLSDLGVFLPGVSWVYRCSRVHWGYGVNVWSCFARLCTCGSPTLLFPMSMNAMIFYVGRYTKMGVFFLIPKLGISSSIEYTLEILSEAFLQSCLGKLSELHLPRACCAV
ncbi:hypothetical protein COCMIDRAFT_107042 [Bipolaris oryzae ATCC 44560]|uniref:Uncharacterized protein n=1 Tax=Bipolaris oryzae ATCC 44560 TaxID=930090 RepID=W6YNZ4_COCMI|nr:uncharacterized protein COCMIDRAFT_107042 [Bipolaris oryzae ATCC 44560]EUC41107.1 hypothetical protein COCMIDRAFT_107042 [Bipolaris oryzae ATCC 44560]